jgi:DNA modification methylase
LRIENIPIGELVCDPSNARNHPEKNLEAIKGSLLKFGQQKPVVINKDNMIVAGNGTVTAARLLQWKKIKCIRTDLDKFNQSAFAIADNRTSELANWDDEILGKTLLALKDDGFDLSDIGFDMSDLDDYLKPKSKGGKTDDDAVLDVDDNPYGVKRGQIWRLGEHRLMCGDSTCKKNVIKLLDGDIIDFIFSDPPYGELQIFNKKGQVGKSNVAKAKEYGEYTGSTTFTLPPMLDAWGGLEEHKYIIWGGNYFADVLPITTSWIVWNKTVGENKHSWFSDFELAWSNLGICGRLFSHMWQGMIREGEKVDRQHPTQKPVELYEWLITKLCKKSKTIGETCLGSGSTLIACEKTARKCYGMEIDPHYCSVIIKRWEEYTGNKAKKL